MGIGDSKVADSCASLLTAFRYESPSLPKELTLDGMSLACSDANVENPLPGSSKEVPPFRYVTATPATLKAKKDRCPLLEIPIKGA